jgi:hypothetical protein
MAEDFERGGSLLYARLAREHADDPVVTELAGDHRPRWEVPLRLFGAVHYLVLAGEEPDAWARFPDVLRERRDRLARFVAEQPVQTNEVQRCWALVPAFLAAAGGRAVDLVELGPSAGLNLLWDRYRYRYGHLAWGPPEAELELSGTLVASPPRSLFRRKVEVRDRIGIDRAPLEVSDAEQALLLQAFVWADQRDRLERLRRAIAAARRTPPRLLRGDYVEVLPELLARRDRQALTLVFNSASTSYLRDEERARLEAGIAEAGGSGPLAWVSYEFEGDDGRLGKTFEDAFALEVQVWPGGERRLVARTDGHGNRLHWLERGR